MSIEFREVTKESLGEILRLTVESDQEKFVATNAVSIAQAHFHEDAWFRGIYDGEAAIGFVMISDIPEKAEYYLWRLMIDKKHQRRGYGRRALELLVDHVRTRPNAEYLYVSYKLGDGSPEGFYRSFGFEPTGELDETGEQLARIAL